MHQDDVEAAVAQLHDVSTESVRPLVEDIPVEWEVDSGAKRALTEFVVRRADFVADTIVESIASECWPGRLFDNR